MSTTPIVSKSKGDRTAAAIAASPKIARLRNQASSKQLATKLPVKPSPAAPIAAPSPAPASGSIVASAIELVPFRDLKRAPENVRHTRRDEDIEPLADDIATHGLLQSLIGYRAVDEAHRALVERVWIAGGGRRLQALGILVDRGVINLDFMVPVLIRDREEAVELSLAENLQKRDMSPVDECHAFVALMAPGTTSPLDLAKRFGFSEMYVRQRLRLAELAEPILQALAEKRITIGAAMAYASSSDRELQKKIFDVQEKAGHDRHAPDKIRSAYTTSQLTTRSALYLFVTPEVYEREGGEYEDDLFSASVDARGVRKLKDGPILLEAARRCAAAQLPELEAEMRAEYPDLGGLLLAPSAQIDVTPWQPKAPAEHVLVEGQWQHVWEMFWKNAMRHRVPLIAIGGISQQGKMEVKRGAFFVPKADVGKVRPSQNSQSSVALAKPPSAEEVAKAERARAIDARQWRLGVGSFAGTPFEGRAFWPSRPHGINAVEASGNPRLRDGQLVTVQIYVTNAQHDAMRDEAERRVDAEAAEREAEKQARAQRAENHADRVEEVASMEPPPAVIVLDGHSGRLAWYRQPDGAWSEAVQADEDDVGYPDLNHLLVATAAGELIETFASIEAYEASIA